MPFDDRRRALPTSSRSLRLEIRHLTRLLALDASVEAATCRRPAIGCARHAPAVVSAMSLHGFEFRFGGYLMYEATASRGKLGT